MFKLITRILIATFAVLRVFQVSRHLTLHYLKHARVFSAETTLSFTVGVCSLVLLAGVVVESQVLLEIWMVWSMLKFGGIIFSVFTLDLETDSFFANSILINITISSSEFCRRKKGFSRVFHFSSSDFRPRDGAETSQISYPTRSRLSLRQRGQEVGTKRNANHGSRRCLV
jgi:hypothetical protein